MEEMSHANIRAKSFPDQGAASAKVLRQNTHGVMEEPQGRSRGQKEVNKRKESGGDTVRHRSYGGLRASGAFRYCFK